MTDKKEVIQTSVKGLHCFENSAKIRKYEHKMSRIFSRRSSHQTGYDRSQEKFMADQMGAGSSLLGRIESSQ
jgi:hypothetical protein